MNFDMQFYKGKNVFITGHTGFKGTWLCAILASAGANVTGYSLGYPTFPSLFKLSGMGQRVISVEGDIRDYDKLKEALKLYENDSEDGDKGTLIK